MFSLYLKEGLHDQPTFTHVDVNTTPSGGHTSKNLKMNESHGRTESSPQGFGLGLYSKHTSVITSFTGVLSGSLRLVLSRPLCVTTRESVQGFPTGVGATPQ